MKTFHAKLSKNRKARKDNKYHCDLCGFAPLRDIFLVILAVFQISYGASFGTAVNELGYVDDLISKGELRKVREWNTVGGTTIRYQQLYQNYPVLGGGVVVRIGKDNQQLSIYNSLAKWNELANPSFTVSSDQAVQIAIRDNPVFPQNGAVQIRDENDVRPLKVILSLNGRPIPCWQVLLPTEKPLGDWEVLVHAVSGKIIQIEDKLQRLDGNGLIFNPDPITALNDSTLDDANDDAEAVPGEAYSEVTLTDISEDDNGLTVLTGPYADTSPTNGRARLEDTDFSFNREDDRFEEVMAYFHIDRQARYIRELGFDDLPPTPQPLNVNGIADDMSFFSPGSGMITFGSGGVDDAEDADAILHEYSHALIHQINPLWRGGDTGMLTEGLCDYFAGDWSLYVDPDFQPHHLYNWDGHNEFWDGRILDADYRYEDVTDLVRHDAGQLWSSLLTEVRLDGNNRDLWNSVVFDHMFLLGDSATVPQAAEALLISDREIADELFRPFIIRSCERRGIFQFGEHSPVVIHTPLGDTDQPNNSRLVTVGIQSDQPLDLNKLYLIYRVNGSEPDTVTIRQNQLTPLQFFGYLPGLIGKAQVDYYLSATDQTNVTSTLPISAPDEWFSYFAGPDHIQPIINQFDQLPNSAFPNGEITVGAQVTDNIGVNSVVLRWYSDQRNGVLTLEPNQDNQYSGRLRWSAELNQTIHYQLHSMDEADNEVLSPVYAFDINRNAVIDNFESDNHRWVKNSWHRSNQDAVNGSFCMTDRDPVLQHLPRVATLELDEEWDLSFAEQARLTFYESHQFDGQAGEVGKIEISNSDGEEWHSAIELTGNQPWWGLRVVNLDDYCGIGASPIRIRFQSVTPIGAASMDGWKIDSVTVAIGNLVDAETDDDPIATEFFLEKPFPNPVNGQLSLDYHLPEFGKLELFDLTGRVLFSKRLSSDSEAMMLDVSQYPTGVYWIKLASTTNSQTHKIVVTK